MTIAEVVSEVNISYGAFQVILIYTVLEWGQSQQNSVSRSPMCSPTWHILRREFLANAQNSTTSPQNLTASNFCLFLKLKGTLRGKNGSSRDHTK